MWSAKLVLFTAASVSFLAYCIYFDRRRLSHPDYKRRVHERRQRNAKARMLREEEAVKAWSQAYEQEVQERLQMQERVSMGIYGGARVPSVNADVGSDGRKSTAQLHFESEFLLGENLLINGHVDESLTHLSNAILLCSKPDSLLLRIQKNLPEQLVRPLSLRVAEMQKRSSRHHSSRHFPGNDYPSDDDHEDVWDDESFDDEWIVEGNRDCDDSHSPDPVKSPITLRAPS